MRSHSFSCGPGAGRELRVAVVLCCDQKVGNGLREGDRVVEVCSFDEERIGAELIGFVGVLDSVGLSQNDHGQFLEVRLRSHPAQDFKTVSDGHFQVQKKKFRERKLRSIGETPECREVRDSFLAIVDRHERRADASFAESAFDQDDVILAVLGQQNSWLLTHVYKLMGWILPRYGALTPNRCSSFLRFPRRIAGRNLAPGIEHRLKEADEIFVVSRLFISRVGAQPMRPQHVGPLT